MSLAVAYWPVNCWADRRAELFTSTRAGSSESLSDTGVTVFLLGLAVAHRLVLLGAGLHSNEGRLLENTALGLVQHSSFTDDVNSASRASCDPVTPVANSYPGLVRFLILEYASGPLSLGVDSDDVE